MSLHHASDDTSGSSRTTEVNKTDPKNTSNEPASNVTDVTGTGPRGGNADDNVSDGEELSESEEDFDLVELPDEEDQET
jgi:hypothetical protein